MTCENCVVILIICNICDKEIRTLRSLVGQQASDSFRWVESVHRRSSGSRLAPPSPAACTSGPTNKKLNTSIQDFREQTEGFTSISAGSTGTINVFVLCERLYVNVKDPLQKPSLCAHHHLNAECHQERHTYLSHFLIFLNGVIVFAISSVKFLVCRIEKAPNVLSVDSRQILFLSRKYTTRKQVIKRLFFIT